MLNELTQKQVELALRVLDQALQTQDVEPMVVPESLQHLSDCQWDQLCLVMESLVLEQRRAVIH